MRFPILPTRLSGHSRLSFFSVFCLILGAIWVVQVTRLIWVLVSPVSPLGEWRPMEAQIMPMSARQALFARFDPFFRGAATGGEGGVVTAMDMQLFGITINAATGGGSAIIAGSDGMQSSFAVGEEIEPGVKLYAVEQDHVVIEHGGARELLYLDQSVPAPTVTPQDAGGSAVSATQKPADVALTAEGVRAGLNIAARKQGDKVTGLVVTAGGDGSVYGRIGFQPGDVIVAVNDRPITAASDIAGLPQQLLPGARISLKVERGASVVPINLQLDK